MSGIQAFLPVAFIYWELFNFY